MDGQPLLLILHIVLAAHRTSISEFEVIMSAAVRHDEQ
jgi:hypothetical protein